jgi:hypothetical protein
MKISLPWTGVPAQLLLETWLQVSEVPPTRIVDKKLAADAELMETWNEQMAESDRVDGQVLERLLENQVRELEEAVELNLDELHGALRAAARARLQMASPWVTLDLPTVLSDGRVVPPEQIHETLMDCFAQLQCILVAALDEALSGS